VHLNVKILQESNDFVHIEKPLLFFNVLESVVSLDTDILFGVVGADFFQLGDSSLSIIIIIKGRGAFIMGGSCGHYSFV
jgi:hypothetical protein